MKFLTKKQVKAAAKRGNIPAARCSWKHHNQLATCTRVEFLEQYGVYGRSMIKSYYCALCCFARGKYGKLNCRTRCRLANDDGCCEEWHGARVALEVWLYEKTTENFQAFQSAEVKLRDYIALKYPEIKK